MVSPLDVRANRRNVLTRVRDLERKVALLGRALSAQGYVDAINDDPSGPALGNADMVDGIHASVAAEANKLLALDADGRWPASAIEGIPAVAWTGAHSFPAAGITIGGDAVLQRGAADRLTTPDSLDVAGKLAVDADEGVAYVNVPDGLSSPPTHRGGLTVRPASATQHACVTQAYTGQSENVEEWRAADDTLLLCISSDGDFQSGSFTSGAVGWQITHDGNAEFNNIVARGEFRASVFVIGEMHADGGTVMILEASVLAEQVTTT